LVVIIVIIVVIILRAHKADVLTTNDQH